MKPGWSNVSRSSQLFYLGLWSRYHDPSSTTERARGTIRETHLGLNQADLCLGALDAGAHGIIVPLIYTVDDAKRLVASAKFPPEGNRGFGSPFSPHAFTGEALTEYLQHANSSLITIVQIETKSALESVREIAAIPGVDCLLIGPFDLGNNIGRPVLGSMHQELKDAIEKIKEAAHAEGKKVGIYCTSGEQAKEFAEKGFDLVSVATDFPAITAAFAGALATAKGKESGEQKGGVKGYDGR
jgi:4-hydroxy-2-oxoheptanedioate aldolase